MNREIKQRWISALRSGRYQQGNGVLRQGDKFCCIGVLCDVMNSAAWSGDQWWSHGVRSEVSLPAQVNHELGLGADMELYLINMNDDGKLFEKIADYIERNL